jgi:serine/threonine protein kinase
MPRARAGESVRGYKLLEDFKMAGGGNCEWTFAVKDGKEYFIKVFLNPKYPRPDGPGSEETKRKMIAECEKFDEHQRKLNDAVKKIAGVGGRLVAASDFFREENLFYKVAVKVPVTPITVKEIARLPLPQKIRLLQNVATAVTSLHRQSIVHGDLKVDNALLERTGADGDLVARLIDFDSSYFSGDPYEVDEMVGDPPYYSPELLNYVQKRETNPRTLTVKSDVFALGLVFHQYLAGEPPSFPDDHKYACDAVRAGHVFTPAALSGVGHDGLANLISSMLELDPSRRPESFIVQNMLKDIRGGGAPTTPTPRPTDAVSPTPLPPGPAKRPGLRGLGLKVEPTAADDPKTPPPAPPPTPVKGGLKISKEFLEKPADKAAASASGDAAASAAAAKEPASVPHASDPSTDLSLPGNYRIVLTNLISSLMRLEKIVDEKTTPPEAPPRVKGTLRGAPLSLSPEQTGSLSEIASRLEELQKHADDVVAWFRGETTDRPQLAGLGPDLEVRGDAGVPSHRVEVVRAEGADSEELGVATDIDEPVPSVHAIPDAVAEAVSTEPPSTEGGSADSGLVAEPVATIAVEAPSEPSTTAVGESADSSGGHRRAERLRNREIRPRS